MTGIWNCVSREKWPQHLWGKAGLGLEVFQRDDLKGIPGGAATGNAKITGCKSFPETLFMFIILLNQNFQ
ncbi:MAG: hypothetical protein B1H12_04120, partial [Desulfobacteraceae bacterium 4484_190.2]